MNLRATDKLEAYLDGNSLSKGNAAEQSGDVSFLELASAKIAQKMTSQTGSSGKSVNGNPDENEELAFYEKYNKMRDNFSRSARWEKRRFKLEQEAKRRRRAQYVRILKESALKRRLREQEAGGKYYTSCTVRKIVSTSCDTDCVSVPVSKESIALLLADRDLVKKEMEEREKEKATK